MRKEYSSLVLLMMLAGLVLVPGIIIIGFGPMDASAQGPSKIVIDMSHGQYEQVIFDTFDTWMANNLTSMGYDVVFAWGGLNDSILADADALLCASINHESASGVTPYTQAEYDAIEFWFDTGGKFLWVGADSDYGGGAWKTSNMTAMLSAVGSHIYPEPSTISDSFSKAGASYRPVANITSDAPFVAELVENVNNVVVHSPTLIYGSTSATDGQDAVALETGSVDNVYPVLYYFNGTIGDQDLTLPYAHTDQTFGSFVAMAVEVNAGSAGDGVIAVSGGAPYGSHVPMYADNEDVRTDLDGYNLVLQTIEWGIEKGQYKGRIVIDMSHGQYEQVIFDSFDTWMANNLTSMGYDVVFAWGGINSTVLADTDALMCASINHESASGVTPYTQAEYDAIEAWYAEGRKFLWVGADSDYGGGAWKTSNMTAMLSAVGSHIYPEPSTISDSYSKAGASYRPVANITSDDPFVAELVENVNNVVVHSPTLIYGSTSATDGQDAVALETGSVDNVYPVLYYFNGTIGDQDLTLPYAHTDQTFGSFVAMAVEVNAGSAGDGVIAVSGGAPYGSHVPMYADSEDVRTDLDGYNLVLQTIEWGIERATFKGKIVIDMSHGQYEQVIFDTFDTWMANNLTARGYKVVFAWGGINSTVLADADALMCASINHESASGVTPYTQAEYDAIEAWYAEGHKFLWVGADSDYGGGAWKTSNMTVMLSAVGSHIYPEPSTISDSYSKAGASYRPVANITSDAAFVADLVEGVHNVVVHSPTLIYGSTSATDGQDAVALETGSVDNVYPVLYYFNGTIGDQDLTLPYAHTDQTFGSFVAMAVEVEAGTSETGVIAVSGGAPYGSHVPMYADSEDVRTDLDGYKLVLQTIEWGIHTALTQEEPVTTTTGTDTTTTTTGTTGTTTDTGPPPPPDIMLYVAVGVAAVVVIVVIVYFGRRR